MKEISLDEALEIISKSVSEMAEEIAEELEAFYEIYGKILLQGGGKIPELNMGEGIVLVDGDLEVGGLVTDSQQADDSMLIVLGNLSCENLVTLSTIYITGNLDVENTILADSCCDCMLMVGENIDCHTLLDYGHTVISRRKINAQDIFSCHAVEDMNGFVADNLSREELVSEITVEEHGEILEDLHKTIVNIHEGRRIFRRN